MSKLADAEGPLLEQILDASYELWHEGLSRFAYGRYYAAQVATVWGRRGLRRLALVDGGEVLASAKLYTFDAVLDGRAVRTVGLGAVFTQPAHRGRGVARDLLGRLLDRSAEDGADLALLFSDIGPDYYAQLGFTPLATADMHLRIFENARRGAPATMVRAGGDRDLADLAAMGETRSARYLFHLTRDRDLLAYAIAKRRLLAGFGPSGARELQFFIAEEGASAVAYVVISVRHANEGGVEWTIEECGDRDPTGARVGAILQVLIARNPAERRPSIRAWLPAGFHPPQVEVIDQQPSSEVMMVKSLGPAGEPARTLRGEGVLYWRGDVF